MEPLHTTLRLGILHLVLTCFMGVTAQTSKTAQNNGLPVSLPSTNKGDTITEKEFTDKVYDVVDEHPHFPGGNGALLDWLSKNIHYTSGCARIFALEIEINCHEQEKCLHFSHRIRAFFIKALLVLFNYRLGHVFGSIGPAGHHRWIPDP